MKHIAIASVLVVIVSGLLILGLNALNLVPRLASEEGALVDQMFNLQIHIIAIIFSLIVVFVLYAIVVFRRRPGETGDGAHVTGNTPLEITWTIIPLIVVMSMGALGAVQLAEMTSPDPHELLVKVTGFQYGWRFEYPVYGVVSSELYLPVGRQVLFELTSTDVIHSFWVPEFRIKQDAVPGRWTTLRVTPTGVGDYRLLCAELCGYAHTAMLAPVVVVEENDFDAWLVGREVAPVPPGSMSPAEKGAAVAELQGCPACHSLDGSQLVGPTWGDLFGAMRTMDDGSTIYADEAYLREAIRSPDAHIVAGYPNIMPVYRTVLTDEEVEGLVEYIKSLGE